MAIERDKIAGMLTNEQMLATPLLVLCIDQFGVEFFDWEPETFDTEIRARFGVEMPTVNRDKVWALVSALTTDLFYKSLETFIPTCNVLSGSEANFEHYDPVTGEEAAWGIVEMLLVDMPENGRDPAAQFSHEIKRYIGLTLQSEGVTSPPLFMKPYVEYDVDPEESVGASIGPDESMLAMYSKRQQQARDEIEASVRGSLEDLIAQLRLLPLQHGDTSKVTAFIGQARSLLKGLPTPEQQVPAAV